MQMSGNNPNWYALYTRHRFEKRVAARLDEKGIENFLPLQTVVRQWSDRRKKVEQPLFNCYVFVRIHLQKRLSALDTGGVVRMVTFAGAPSPIRDEEIEAVRRILSGEVEYESTPAYEFDSGQKVEVVRGPLRGIRGRFVEHRGRRKLLVNIDQISQGICIEVDESDVLKCGR